MSLLQPKLQCDSTNQPDYPILCLNCHQQWQFHQHFGSFGGEIVELTRQTHSGWLPICSTMCFFWIWHSDLITQLGRVPYSTAFT